MRFLALASTAVVFLFLKNVHAQSPAWGQCGGQGWTGPTTCVAGYTCTPSNQWYSQCLPGTASSSPPSSLPSNPTTTTRSTTVSPPTTTSSGPAPTGSQIRTVQDPVYHFYLQDHGGKPQLGPESSSGMFTISGSIALNSSSGSKLYLNVNNSASTSYKPLTLDATATTTNWGLEGDTIITTSPRQLNFIACTTSDPAYYDVYLQTGNDTPSGASCTLVTMHLPCLC